MSQPAAAPSAADALVAALAATLEALQAGDIAAAETAVEAVNRSCAELGQQPGGLSPEQLTRARALQASCEALAGTIQTGVVANVLQTATHRRASDAYGSKT